VTFRTRFLTKIDSLDVDIISRAQDDRDVELLRTIPFVAYFTTLALRLESEMRNALNQAKVS